MTNEFKDMLKMLKCSIRCEGFQEDFNTNYLKVGSFAMQQQVMPIIFPLIEQAYQNGRFDADAQLIENMKHRVLTSVIFEVQREEFLKMVLRKMEMKNIKCILLKGALLADLYPVPERRISGDIDLFVDGKDEKKAIKILESCGFSVRKRLKGEYHSECHHKTAGSLELHVSLYEDYCTDLWFDSMTFNTNNTETYITKSGYKYTALETNEQLLFNILHLIKHFLSSGIGIRQITDIILYTEKNYEKLDYEKYASVMKNLKFDYFMDCCMKIGVDYLGANEERLLWINKDRINDNDVIKILNDIEDSGLFGHNDIKRRTFGKVYTKTLMETKKYKERKGGLFKKIFLSYDRMAAQYKYLQHKKWLLPVAWMQRGLRVVFIKKRKPEPLEIQDKHLQLMRDMKIL